MVYTSLSSAAPAVLLLLSRLPCGSRDWTHVARMKSRTPWLLLLLFQQTGRHRHRSSATEPGRLDGRTTHRGGRPPAGAGRARSRYVRALAPGAATCGVGRGGTRRRFVAGCGRQRTASRRDRRQHACPPRQRARVPPSSAPGARPSVRRGVARTAALSLFAVVACPKPEPRHFRAGAAHLPCGAAAKQLLVQPSRAPPPSRLRAARRDPQGEHPAKHLQQQRGPRPSSGSSDMEGVPFPMELRPFKTLVDVSGSACGARHAACPAPSGRAPAAIRGGAGGTSRVGPLPILGGG